MQADRQILSVELTAIETLVGRSLVTRMAQKASPHLYAQAEVFTTPYQRRCDVVLTSCICLSFALVISGRFDLGASHNNAQGGWGGGRGVLIFRHT